VILVAILAILASVPFPAAAALQGSAHDFSTYGWSGGEICILCHGPHGTPGAEAPLWNHAISNATYVLYDSPTMAEPTEQPGPGGISRLCLSCHDGTTAIDYFGGTQGTTYIDAINPNALVGTDLSNDHPIGVYWNHQEQTHDCLNCHDIQNMTIKDVKFYNRRVECPSCHDVHNDVPNPKLLRLPMSGSRLCFQCHGK
jgi:predicted CXXCH cytochrome family protein